MFAIGYIDLVANGAIRAIVRLSSKETGLCDTLDVLGLTD